MFHLMLVCITQCHVLFVLIELQAMCYICVEVKCVIICSKHALNSDNNTTHNYRCGTTGHVLQVWHNWSCITGVAQLAMYYRCSTTGHVLQVWHNWPCITGIPQLTMYYRCTTTGHVLQVYHNWPCITDVPQLAMYYRCTTTGHVLQV